MELFVYEFESRRHVATIYGLNNEVCEAKADELYWGDEDYAYTYSPAFGFDGGLKENQWAKNINA